MKSVKVVAVCAILYSLLTFSVYASITGTAKADPQTGIVTVSGVCNNPSDLVSAAVFRPSEGQAYTLSELQKDALIGFRVMKPEQDGKFQFVFKLPSDAPFGKYSAVLGATDWYAQENERTVYFYYITQEYLDEIIADANAANANGLAQILSDNSEILGIADLLANAVYTENTDAILKNIADVTFASTADIRSALLEQMGLIVLNSAQSSSLSNVLATYGDALGFDTGETYLYLKEYIFRIFESQRAEFGSVTSSNKQEFFTSLTAIATVNASTRETIVSELIKYANVFAINTSGISKNEEIHIAKNMRVTDTDKEYKTVSAVKAAFVSARSSYKEPQGGGTSANAGGSGKGKSTIPVTIDPTILVDNTEKAPVFTDLAGFKWAEEAIEALAAANVVIGKESGIFAPGDFVTREEFVKMIVSALHLSSSGEDPRFTDTLPDGWYIPHIKVAYNLDIVKGYEDNTFGIGQLITREEIAVIAFRGASAAGVLLPKSGNSIFSDKENIAGYAVESVDALKTFGILNGYEDNTFRPASNATRAECAKIIYELLLKINSERKD